MDRYGYYKTAITHDSGVRKNITIHRLVALAFIANPEGKHSVDHINQNKLDNSISNLRWANNSEQQNNRRHVLSKSGHKYIYISDNKFRLHITQCTSFLPPVSKCFKTLEEAIAFRDHHLA